MITGDSVPKLLSLQTAAGGYLSYADKTAFQAAGWDLIWRDVDGVALSSQPTWTIADEGRGIHRLKYTVPSGFYWVEPTVPSGYRIDPAAWSDEGQAYDEDSLAGLLQSSQGVPSVISADDSDLGDIVMGDAWTSDVQTVPLGKISRFGYSDLSGMSISASFMDVANGTEVPISSSIVSSASRTVKSYFDVFPVAMNLAGGVESKAWYLDIQLKHTVSGRIITVLRYSVTVVWQRNTTT